MNLAQKENAEKRRHELIDYLNSLGNETFYMKDLAGMLNVSSFTIRADMNAIRDKLDGKIVENDGRRGSGYKMIRQEKEERVSMKNPEGYLDLTAGIAIRNADKEDKKPKRTIVRSSVKPMAGQIYSSPCSDGTSVYILTFEPFAEFTEYIPLVERPDTYNPPEYNPYLIPLKQGRQCFTADIRRISTKPNKYIGRYEYTVDFDKMDSIRQAVIDIWSKSFNVKPMPKPEPELVVEPVTDTLEMELLKQKVEIYERLLFERKIPL